MKTLIPLALVTVFANFGNGAETENSAFFTKGSPVSQEDFDRNPCKTFDEQTLLLRDGDGIVTFNNKDVSEPQNEYRTCVHEICNVKVYPDDSLNAAAADGDLPTISADCFDDDAGFTYGCYEDAVYDPLCGGKSDAERKQCEVTDTNSGAMQYTCKRGNSGGCYDFKAWDDARQNNTCNVKLGSAFNYTIGVKEAKSCSNSVCTWFSEHKFEEQILIPAIVLGIILLLGLAGVAWWACCRCANKPEERPAIGMHRGEVLM